MKNKFVCKNCGKEYYSYKTNSRFCCRQCRKEYNNIEYNCDYCGKKTIINRNKHNKLLSGELKHIYCSKECTTNAQTKKVTKKCEYCGKEYKIGKCFEDIQRFCSRKCYDQYKKENAFSYNFRVCPNCGKEYFPKHRNQIYCCKQCVGESVRSQYKDLMSYFRGVNRHWHKKFMELSNNKCQLTGTTKDLVIHHIVSFKSLVEETMFLLDLPLDKTISSYSFDELEKMRTVFRSVQDNNPCIVIHKNIHQLFHSKYGFGNNTEAQWKEFIEKYKDKFKDLV